MKTILLSVSLLITACALGQASDNPAVEHKIFQVVEQMPQFPGGDEAMMKFVKTNLQYPDSSKRLNIQGIVVVGFMVNEDGSISNPIAKKSVSPDIDKEAVRIVKLFPKFKPGMQQGKAVRVSFILPIRFILN